MPLATLAIVLTAATVHATWNLIVVRAQDRQATTAIVIAVSVVLFLPVALLSWHLEPEVWPYVAVSGMLEIAYYWMLTVAYQRAEMSLIYPIARGSAPVLVLIGSVLIVGAPTSAGQAIGVVLVAAGILMVRGLRGPARWADVGIALAVAGLIASYTLVDAQGVKHADPLTYLVLILVPPAIAAVAFIAVRGGVARVRRSTNTLSLVGGVCNGLAYALVLIALTQAPAPSVSAVRETSVVIATVLAAVVLKERVGPIRLMGSIVVALGVAFVVLG